MADPRSLLKHIIGLSGDNLAQAGQTVYPRENVAENQQAHRLGSKLLTDRFGPFVAQGLGVANEVAEPLVMGQPPGEDWLRDIGANIRGTVDSYWEDPNSPQGLVRMLQKALMKAR